MAGKNTAVFGIYPNRGGVDNAVDALKAAEFRNTDISVLFPETSGTKDFAHEKNTKAPEGTATGAGTGALLGGGLGWLVGIGALAIPTGSHCNGMEGVIEEGADALEKDVLLTITAC
jgi:hypothetical protein